MSEFTRIRLALDVSSLHRTNPMIIRLVTGIIMNGIALPKLVQLPKRLEEK